MSTLIPLRSGVGVYATLEKRRGKKKKEKKRKRENVSHSPALGTSEMWCPVPRLQRDPRDLVPRPQTLSDHREFMAFTLGLFSAENTTTDDKRILDEGYKGQKKKEKRFHSSCQIPLSYEFSLQMSTPAGFVGSFVV